MAFIQGSGGNDILDGTPLGDEILGLAGNDFIRGLGGNDIIDGGDGDDTVNGNEGNDFVQGGRGNDFVYGGQGDDVVLGGEGNDNVNGNKGNDLVFGGVGNDTVRGGQENDTVLGGDGNDVLYGDIGVDELIGGSGIDVFVLQQGKGGDTIVDFTLGEDFFGLDTLDGGGVLSFGNLTFTQSGNNVNISAGGQVIAVVRNVLASDLTEELFTTDLTAKTTPPQVVRGNNITGTVNDDSIGATSSSGVTGIPGNTATAQNDTINGLAGNDTINGLAGNDQINGGEGNDALIGGDGNDTLLGEGGNDTLQGGNGNDSLVGGAGNDVLFPGGGNSVAAGGAGLDVFVLESTTSLIVTDFNSSEDYLGLLGIARPSLTIEQAGANTIIRLNPARQVLATLVNVDSSTITDRNFTTDLTAPTNPPIFIPGNQISGTIGNDSIGATASAGVVGIPGNTATEGNDTISGIQGNDTINGLGGNDFIDGGDGNDLINGGNGNDTINAGFGNDTLQGGSGNDSLIGGPGNDVIDPGEGNDTVTGGVDRDVFVLAPRTEPVTITDFTPVDDFIALTNGLALTNIQITQVGSDTVITSGVNPIARLLNVPASTISAGNFTSGIIPPPDQGNPGNNITGTAGNDQIGTIATPGVTGGTATDQNDTIVGLGGNDTISGLGGNDSIDGGDGNDIIDGGSGADTLSGGNGNDTLLGGSGNDSLNGGEGSDVLFGGLGNSTLTGGGGFDVFVIDSVTNQTITVTDFNVNQDYLGLNSGLTFDALGFTVEGGNTLIRTGGRLIATLLGVTLAPVPLANFTTELTSKTTAPGGVITGGNLIQGTVNNDTIGATSSGGVTGNPGNIATNFADTIFGGAGDDQIAGLGGNDSIQGESGNDTIIGGDGNDTLDGGSGNDRLIGESGDDLLIGADGNDTLEGESGNDTLQGGAGNDVLLGSDGNDSIEGGSGDDNLQGGDGNDTLRGGSGNDTITGGAGIDFFVFEAAGDNGFDKIVDFIIGTDKLDFRIENSVRPLRGNPNPSVAVVTTPGTNIGSNNIIILNTGSLANISALSSVPSNTVIGGTVGDRVLVLFDQDSDSNPLTPNETIVASASLTSDGRFTAVFGFASLPGGIGNYLALTGSDFVL
jgi:Ca2+-binding RTX toxin-like protein